MTDAARVDVVANVLAVVMLGNPHAHEWATAVVEALDGHDKAVYVHNQRGQMGFDDETEANDDD